VSALLLCLTFGLSVLLARRLVAHSPFFAVLFAFCRRSEASERPTWSLSLNRPFLLLRTKRLSPLFDSINSLGIEITMSSMKSPGRTAGAFDLRS
jgi:hypothetical protein